MADQSQKTSPKRRSPSQIETTNTEYDDTAKAPSMRAGEPTKVKLRSQQTFMHHLFKATIAIMRKNVSWVKFQPKLVDVEHVHFFHTKNSMGMPQEYTNEVGGHFHKIEWGVDASGNPVAKCGPALKKIQKRGRGGLMSTINKPISWVDKFDEESEERVLTDDHVHDMVYMGSDELSVIKQTHLAPGAAMGFAPRMPTNDKGESEIEIKDMTADA
jgi:hypothetical protein